jgi:hypothetical protein
MEDDKIHITQLQTISSPRLCKIDVKKPAASSQRFEKGIGILTQLEMTSLFKPANGAKM